MDNLKWSDLCLGILYFGGLFLRQHHQIKRNGNDEMTAWIIIFVSFIGPLYDSNGYITNVAVSDTQVFKSKTSCTYISKLMNGKLSVSNQKGDNFTKLEKKKSLCISINDWSNISNDFETYDLNKIDIDLLFNDS